MKSFLIAAGLSLLGYAIGAFGGGTADFDALVEPARPVARSRHDRRVRVWADRGRFDVCDHLGLPEPEMTRPPEQDTFANS